MNHGESQSGPVYSAGDLVLPQVSLLGGLEDSVQNMCTVRSLLGDKPW